MCIYKLVVRVFAYVSKLTAMLSFRGAVKMIKKKNRLETAMRFNYIFCYQKKSINCITILQHWDRVVLEG